MSMNVTQTLNLSNPSEIFKYLSYYSPIILITGIVSLSFIFQNFKGIVYLALIFILVVSRELIYQKMYPENETTLQPDCNMVLYSLNQNSNASFSAFIFSFTLMYIFLPMFINQNINVWMLLGLSIYFIFDMFIKHLSRCVKPSNLFVNILLGFGFSAVLICAMINTPGLSNLLFFNDLSSNKEICTMPKKQTFKCSVYKNGELIGSSIT